MAINLSGPQAIRPMFKITSLHLAHNHEMDPMLPSYAKLTVAMVETIKMCAKMGDSSSLSLRMLRYKHPMSNFNEQEVTALHKKFVRDPKTPLSQSAALVQMLGMYLWS